MKKLTILSLTIAGLCAAPVLTQAADEAPPKPPGGDKAPPAAEKPADKPEAKRERGPGALGGAEGRGRMEPGERLKMMKEKLNLTSEQEEKVRAVMEKNAPQFRELMAKGRDNLTEADKEKFRELMRSQTEEIGAILTPEQKEKMKELRPAGGGAAGDRKPGEGRRKPDGAK